MQKKIQISCCALFIIFSVSIRGQAIENTINLYGTNFPQEKIHMHFDKESYLPGETIWFKAYLFEENQPSQNSTNFYAALYDEQGKLVKQQVSPVFNSSSDGHFDIPDTLRSTRLICRAYTSWMLNFDTAMFFSQPIKISSNTPLADNALKTTSLRFFSEGGSIIDAAVNTIAFKANYNNGLPFLVEGAIKKQETGEVLVPLTVAHDGMGRFDLEFVPGEKYYAEWTDNTGAKQQTMLPVPATKGVALKLSVQKEKLFYNLVNKTGNDSLHVLMYMYQKVFYTAHIKVNPAEPYTGIVPSAQLPTGTMQLTVFDAGWQPVAERVAFINNNNFTINASVNNKEVSTKKRGKNVLEILVADTVPANMSLSITDADMNNVAAENTILSNFLLKGDLKGYIHNPAYYFTSNTDATLRSQLDLVMMTNGWRRYNWKDVMAQKMPALRVAADQYLGVYGQVAREAMDKLEKDETVNLIVKTIDSTNNFYSVLPDKSGVIKQNNLVFYDSARVYFTFNKSKPLNKQMAFSRSNFTLNQPAAINNYAQYQLPDTNGTMQQQQHTALFNYYRTNGGVNLFNQEKTMEGVVIKTGKGRKWQNDPLVKLDERYASGMFSGGALGYSVDVLHDEKAWTKFDFYNYIRSTIPGLLIGNFNLTSGRSLSYRDKSVLVYIDEHEMTTSDLESLSLTQIAYIKFIPNFMGRGADPGGGSMNPAISVYTRKGDDLIDRRPKETDLNMVKIAGYTPLKEFYSPDYSQTNTTISTDARTTLLWLPYILTDKTNRKIPVSFYNNDFTRKMRVVLEGINDEGKMIRIEKIIE